MPGELRTIAAGAEEVWGTNLQEQIFRFNWSTQKFEQVPGSLRQVEVGFNDEVWGVNVNQAIYHHDRLNRRWKQIPGRLTQIVIGGQNQVWGLNQNGQIYRLRQP